MNDPKHDPELVRLADELSTTLRDLTEELRAGREPPRGPLGLPRPPTPRELLRFTDEYTIPTAIAVLEANVRMLEALQGAIRLARTGDEVDKRGREARARTEEFGLEALDQLDNVLSDLQSALDGRPTDPEARTLLDDARALRREIDDRLRETDASRRRPAEWRTTEDTLEDAEGRPASNDASQSREEGVAIDVDSELDSIREEVDGENDDGDSEDI